MAEWLDDLGTMVHEATREPVRTGRMVNEDGSDPKGHDDLIQCVSVSIRKGEGTFYGVFIDNDEDPCPWVCHTGNGPTSLRNADFIAELYRHAPELIRLARIGAANESRNSDG